MAVADTFEEPLPSPQMPHIVINEIYYWVDSDHGWDSPKDRGVSTEDDGDQIIISENGADSQNSVFMDNEEFCNVTQENQTEAFFCGSHPSIRRNSQHSPSPNPSHEGRGNLERIAFYGKNEHIDKIKI